MRCDAQLDFRDVKGKAAGGPGKLVCGDKEPRVKSDTQVENSSLQGNGFATVL